MRWRNLTAMASISALMAVFVPAIGVAQESGTDAGDELELTMTLLPEGATEPDAVTKTIELPAPASDEAGAHSAQGTNTANDAREHREAGLDTATEARERGREFGQDMAAEAQQNREDQGHDAVDHPTPTDHPGPTDLPTPPEPPQPDHPTPPSPPGPPGS